MPSPRTSSTDARAAGARRGRDQTAVELTLCPGPLLNRGGALNDSAEAPWEVVCAALSRCGGIDMNAPTNARALAAALLRRLRGYVGLTIAPRGSAPQATLKGALPALATAPALR